MKIQNTTEYDFTSRSDLLRGMVVRLAEAKLGTKVAPTGSIAIVTHIPSDFDPKPAQSPGFTAEYFLYLYSPVFNKKTTESYTLVAVGQSFGSQVSLNLSGKSVPLNSDTAPDSDFKFDGDYSQTAKSTPMKRVETPSMVAFLKSDPIPDFIKSHYQIIGKLVLPSGQEADVYAVTHSVNL